VTRGSATATTAGLNGTILTDFGTGTAGAPPAKTLKARTDNGILYISGLTAGKPWSIYGISGLLLRQGTAAGPEITVTLPAQGMYVVVSGEEAVKVVY
jgi:hypothetical protein